MRDHADFSTAELDGLEVPKRGRGQPKKYHTEEEKKAAQADAARAYRARKKAEKEARKKPENKLESKIIDLSAVKRW